MAATIANEDKKRTLSVLVENRSGVLSQVARLFSRNGVNIDSFTAGTTTDLGVTRLTIEITTDDDHTKLICAQLNKMVPVHSVKLLDPNHAIRRELVMFKCKAITSEARNEIIQIGSIFRGSVIDISQDTLTLSVIGDEGKIDAVKEMLEPYGIIEMARSGISALERGKYTIDENTKEKREYDYGTSAF